MSPPENQDVVDENYPMDDQPVPWIINVASTSVQAAAYWQGRCEGLETILAYLKARLDRIEGLFVEVIQEGKEATS